ncbi:hypothetical protein NQZ79_g1103 [Umbelopsis isabellina]|nr:hypothetical protein NQZ79_g1103 [Umbelopsis isabellina]
MYSALGKHERTSDVEDTDMDFMSDQEDFSLPRNYQPTGYIDTDHLEQADMSTHLPETNIGYRLLCKMGWSAGQGLGSDRQGRVDPIRIDLKMDSLGIGKAEEEEDYHISSTAQRRALDSEKQMEESEQERIVRETVTHKKEEVKNDIKEILRAFYCELCDKQYSKISEYEQHLQSYDHHHKKRFKDMRESSKSTQGAIAERAQRRERERKREERENRRIQEAMMKRSGIQLDAIPKITAAPTVKMAEVGTKARNNSEGTAAAQPSTGGWATVSEESSPTNAPRTSGWTVDVGPEKDITKEQNMMDSQATIPFSASIAESEKANEVPKLFAGKNSKPAPKMSFGMNKKSNIKFGFGK